MKEEKDIGTPKQVVYLLGAGATQAEADNKNLPVADFIGGAAERDFPDNAGAPDG